MTLHEDCENVFVKRYGPHGYEAFPDHRIPTEFYQWRRPFDPHTRAYLVLDATVPFLFIAKTLANLEELGETTVPSGGPEQIGAWQKWLVREAKVPKGMKVPRTKKHKHKRARQ